MKKAVIPSIVLLSILCLGLTQNFSLKEGTVKPMPSNALQQAAFVDLNKFYLPPEAAKYVQKKYPDGRVPLPLDPVDEKALQKYLSLGRYIVELREEPLSEYKKEATGLQSLEDHVAKMTDEHLRVAQLLSLAEGKPSVRREYMNVLDGMSLENVSEKDVIYLGSLDAVKKIYPIKSYHITLSESVPMIGAAQAWGMKDALGRNITGKGVTIAIVDTGIDYTHPDLGNCTGRRLDGSTTAYSLSSEHPYHNDMTYNWTIKMPGYSKMAVHFKTIDTEYGYDVIYLKNSTGNTVKTYTGIYNDTWSPSVSGDTLTVTFETDWSDTSWGFEIDKVLNGTVSSGLSNCSKVVGGYNFIDGSDDPMDDQGHGTHCAGIAAGNGTLKGVAPDAKLLAYKVMSSAGEGSEDDIIAGIDRAVNDSANVISLSLGGYGSPDDALSTAVDNAVAAGVVVAVAAGNNGPDNGTIASPGCARKALTVGAIYKRSDPGRNRLSNLSVDKAENPIDSFALSSSITTPSNGVTGILTYSGLGLSTDFAGKNLAGMIALIKRGNITFNEKVRNAYNAGAVGAIIYNNYYGNFKGDLVNVSSIPAVSISEEDGEYLSSLLDNGTVSATIIISLDPNIIADFSSRGPAYIYDKPDVLAPGVAICSARWATSFSETPCLDDRHVALSGTSMATPHVAGAAALLLQKDPTWSPLQIKAALKDTAQDLGYDSNIQGAGVINVSAALMLTSPPPVALINNLEGVTYEEK